MFVGAWVTGEVMEWSDRGTPKLQAADRGGGVGAPAIIVAGAGPVGLAAALLLDGLGYAVTLVAPERTGADGRTSALLAGSVALLERIGVWREAEAAAAPLRSLRIVDATRRLIRAPEVLFHAEEIGLEAFGYNIPNVALLAALEAAFSARGIARRTATVDALAGDPAAVTADLSDGTRLSAPLIVAADGRRSRDPRRGRHRDDGVALRPGGAGRELRPHAAA